MKTHLEFRWTISRGRDSYGYNICSLWVDGRKLASCNGGGYDMKGTSLGNFIAARYASRLVALKPEDMPEQSHWESDCKRVCAGECLEKYRKAITDAIVAGGSGDGIERMLLPEDCFECPTCGGRTVSSGGGRRVQDGRSFYGLTFHDPNYDPGKAVVGQDCSDRTMSTDGHNKGKTVAEVEAAGQSVGLERYQAFYSASSKHPTERHTVPLIDGACGFSSVEQIMKAIGLSLEWVPTRSKKQDVYILHDNKETQ